MSYEKWVKFICPGREIILYCGFCLFCQIDNSELSSLSSDGEFECFKVHIIST